MKYYFVAIKSSIFWAFCLKNQEIYISIFHLKEHQQGTKSRNVCFAKIKQTACQFIYNIY